MRRLTTVVGMLLVFGASSVAAMAQGTAASTPAAKPSTAAAAKSSTAAASGKVAPSGQTDAQIADAKAKGMVWANKDSKVYHKEGQFYGKTKQGQFMTEADAQKAGYKEAKSSPVGKKKTTAAK